ncbi:MAG: metal-sensing transcriptional repressor [Clostridia bacterium]|nr:metal-sensing transcriptional repressor [Clostridia bacterium]
MENCEYCKNYRETPRGEEELKSLISRVNRVKGQVEGIKAMLEENRYCGDILIQISAAESALRSLSYLILEEHLATCVTDKIKSGDKEIIKETVELVKKLK